MLCSESGNGELNKEVRAETSNISERGAMREEVAGIVLRYALPDPSYCLEKYFLRFVQRGASKKVTAAAIIVAVQHRICHMLANASAGYSIGFTKTPPRDRVLQVRKSRRFALSDEHPGVPYPLGIQRAGISPLFRVGLQLD